MVVAKKTVLSSVGIGTGIFILVGVALTGLIGGANYLIDEVQAINAEDQWAIGVIDHEVALVDAGKSVTLKQFEEHRVEHIGNVGALEPLGTKTHEGREYDLALRLMEADGTVDLVITYDGRSFLFDGKDGVVTASSGEVEEMANEQNPVWK